MGQPLRRRHSLGHPDEDEEEKEEGWREGSLDQDGGWQEGSKHRSMQELTQHFPAVDHKVKSHALPPR